MEKKGRICCGIRISLCFLVGLPGTYPRRFPPAAQSPTSAEVPASQGDSPHSPHAFLICPAATLLDKQRLSPPCRIYPRVKGPKGYCCSLSSICNIANCHGREVFGRTGTGENALTSITCRELMGRDKEPLFGSRKYNKKLSKTKQDSFGESQKNCSLKEFQSLMQRFGILQCIAHDCQTHDCL